MKVVDGEVISVVCSPPSWKFLWNRESVNVICRVTCGRIRFRSIRFAVMYSFVSNLLLLSNVALILICHQNRIRMVDFSRVMVSDHKVPWLEEVEFWSSSSGRVWKFDQVKIVPWNRYLRDAASEIMRGIRYEADYYLRSSLPSLNTKVMKYRVGAFLRVRDDEKDCVRREERRDTHLVSSLWHSRWWNGIQGGNSRQDFFSWTIYCRKMRVCTYCVVMYVSLWKLNPVESGWTM